MKYQYRQQRQGDFAHPNRWIITLEPKEGTGCVEEDGIEHDDDYEGDAIAIEVLGVGPVVASWVEIAKHVACGGIDRVDGWWEFENQQLSVEVAVIRADMLTNE